MGTLCSLNVDEIRYTRPWFWILMLIVFGVALAGLLVAISAKDSSVDEKKLVDDATAQIKEELSGLSGALRVADRFQEEESKAAARDRARLRRAVAGAEAGARRRVRKLTGRIASLEDQMAQVQDQNVKLRKNVAALTQGQLDLASEVAAINRRIRRLSNPVNGGT
jgi:chromosome segregation ATPase